MRDDAAEITLGPVPFNWNAQAWRDFYFRIAEEAPVATVYLGEAICSKRAPLFEPHVAAVTERLTKAGKTVVFSTLAEVMLKHDRRMIESVCASKDFLVEANDGSALFHLCGRAHHIGPFLNVYNEHTVAFLARGGAKNFCLPAELPAAALRALCAAVDDPGVTFEVQVFGRLPLALSARCYHARAHGRTKDTCQFVCENDADGLPLRTLDGKAFLVINGVQTMSHDYLNLVAEIPDMQAMGITRFRLSPHSCDMVEVASIFRDVLDRRIDTAEGAARLDAMQLPAPFSNGFYHGKPGFGRHVQ